MNDREELIETLEAKSSRSFEINEFSSKNSDYH